DLYYPRHFRRPLRFPSSLVASFLVLLARPPRSALFPYTTLFRSIHLRRRCRWPRSWSWFLRHVQRCPSRPCRSTWRRNQLHDLRSEEHTTELQSHLNLVCRLLPEKTRHSALRYINTGDSDRPSTN